MKHCVLRPNEIFPSLEDGMLPSLFAADLTHILHKCRKERDVVTVLRLISCMCKDGLESHASLGNHLIALLVEVGSICDAQQLFDRLVYRNEDAWNSLIMGYIQCGEPQHAFFLYRKILQDDHVNLTRHTIVALLNMCGKLKDLKKGEEIHANVTTSGLLKRDIFIGSTLVDMYAKCGSLVKAHDVFNDLPIRNVVTWTALIAGYVEQGLGKEALNLFDQMQSEGVPPNAVTFVCSLTACRLLEARDKGQELHVEIERQGLLEKNPFVGSALVDMYAKCGALVRARQVFNMISFRNVVSWTALMAGHTEQNCGQEALQCFEQMQMEGVFPDSGTLVCTLKACGRVGALEGGLRVHVGIEGEGSLGRDPFICSTLVDMYAKCGSIVKARQVFERLQVRTVVSWNALIAGYVEDGQGEEALTCFEQMQLESVIPTAVTFICALQACAGIGATDRGAEIHGEIERRGLLERDLVGNTLISMYVKCGALDKAQKVFDKLSIRDIFSFTTLMTGYAQLGESDPVFDMFDRMLGEGVKPNPVTFIVLLNACSRTGLFHTSHTYYEAMSQDFGIAPTLEHASCMVDLLGRVGQFDRALAVIKKMQFSPDVVMWHALLSASKKWGNVGIGKQAFKHAVLLNKNDSAAYVLMSHIYEGAEKESEARETKQSLSYETVVSNVLE